MSRYFNNKKKWLLETIISYIGFAFLLLINSNTIEFHGSAECADVSEFKFELTYPDLVLGLNANLTNVRTFEANCQIESKKELELDAHLAEVIEADLNNIYVNLSEEIVDAVLFNVIEAETETIFEKTIDFELEPSVFLLNVIPFGCETNYVFVSELSNPMAGLINVIEVRQEFVSFKNDLYLESAPHIANILRTYLTLNYDYDISFDFNVHLGAIQQFNLELLYSQNLGADFSFNFIQPMELESQIIYNQDISFNSSISLTTERKFSDLNGLKVSDLNGLKFFDLMYN